MGFRNPITSAAAVDTGQPAGAAARVYEGSDATGVFGVLEFRDGISGDSPAQAIGRANLVPQGGGYTQQGGGLAVKGGSYNGVTAPEIDLNVEAIPAGGYGPVARVKGAGLVIDTAGTRMPGGGVAGLVPLLGAASSILTTTDANGLVVVTHGLGVNPTSVLITPANSGAIPNLVDFVLVSTTTTQFTVRAMRRDNNTAFGGNPVGFEWLAVLPAS